MLLAPMQCWACMIGRSRSWRGPWRAFPPTGSPGCARTRISIRYGTIRGSSRSWATSDRTVGQLLNDRLRPTAGITSRLPITCCGGILAPLTMAARQAWRDIEGMGMMRRLVATVGFAGSAVLAATSAWAMVDQLGPGEGQVSIVAWPGYIERGETDKAYDWVTKFEAKTGCKVDVKTAGTSDEMVALMNEGGFDLVTASGDASLRLVSGKRVQPINVDLIPSWK